MARQARTESATSFYHVMMRGNNREYIFSREDQKKRFMDSLRTEAATEAIQIVAWCLMDNHVHLVLKGELSELTQAIKRINTKYAMGFNGHENRIGHVFQDRFKSEVIEDDNHLLAAIRYVHNNPVKARMTELAGAYPWSSYSEYLQPSALISRELREMVLGYFGGDSAKFEAFHLQRDNEEYLEIKEDAEKYRMERAQEIITAYCHASGLQDAVEFQNNSGGLNELIAELLDVRGLSHRKIAALLEVSHSRVHQVSLKR